MGNSCKVHHLLYGARAELCETRHTSAHHILMITKDRESLRSNRTSSYVVDTWEQLTSYLVHIR